MMAPRHGPRPVRRLVTAVVACAALALGPAGCGRGLVNRVTGSPSPSPTFLDEQAVCEVTSTDALREAVSFQTVDYEYWHDSYPKKPDQNSFQCRIRGRDASANLSPTAFYISYEPGGYLDAIGGIRPFTDLDGEGHDPLVLDGVEGRGYMWLDSPNVDGVITSVDAAWLYPDNHALEIQLFLDGTTDYAYDQDDIAAMTDLLHALIPAIPPVAARTDQSRTWVPFP